ncbi:lipid-A-disaccharide synthase [Bacteroidales bacterium]|nr:lipid-A-disaccharide synthase [Bacteroidales bacterium]
MKYYLVVGEASGDLHAANLMRSLREEDEAAEFRFFGGDLMQAQGGSMVKHYKEMAFMGFIPVLLNLPTILKNMALCKGDIALFKPDVVILVDYPGFNLKIAKYVKLVLKIPVHYYISPKIWAWKKWRIKDIRKYIDQMLCILPFEVEFYKKNDYDVQYVGNPTVDAVAQRPYLNESFEEFVAANNLTSSKPIIALLAGSRKQEIKDNLPPMIEATRSFADCQVVIAGAPGIEPSLYDKYIGNESVAIVFDQTYRLLQNSKAAMVCSGTATLETALLRTPQLVCYQTPIKHVVSFVFENLFSTKYISLVNLIADKTVVKELFAKHFSIPAMEMELKKILYDTAYRNNMLSQYEEVIKILGKSGASTKAAKIIVTAASRPYLRYCSE